MIPALLLLLATAPEVSAVENLATERDQPRVKAGISLLGGTFTGMTTQVLFLPTLGLSGEVGSRFDDRVSVVARASAVANYINLNLGLEGLIDFALNDHFALGGGTGLHFFFGYTVTQSLIVMLPVRLTFSPMTRGPNQVARSGLIFGLELAGGMVVFSVPGAGIDLAPIPIPRAWVSGQLSVGYAWW